jgi:hypothetical protein
VPWLPCGTKVYLNHLPNEAEIGEADTEDEIFGFKFLRSDGKILLDDTLEVTADDPYYERLVIGYAHLVRRLYE